MDKYKNLYFISKDANWQKYRLDVLTKLGKQYNFNITILTTGKLKDYLQENKVVKYKKFISWLPINKNINLFPGALLYIFKEKPDYVLALPNASNLTEFLALPLCKILNIPIVYWTHGYDHGKRKKTFFNSIRVLIVEYFLKKSDLIFTFSNGGREYLIHKDILPEKIIVAPNTLNTDLWINYYKRCKQIKEDNNFRILFSGRLNKDKKVINLLKAIKLIDNKNIRVDIIGDGEERRKLEEYVKDNNIKNIYFHGYIFDEQEVSNYFCQADIFVMPGYVGLAIVHAFCFALPIITEDISYHSPEIQYLKNGKNGYFVKKNNHKELAQKIIQIFSDKKLLEKLSKNAFCTASNEASIDNMIAQMHKGFNILNKIEKIRKKKINNIVLNFLLRDDLPTYDPYDIWKTGIGVKIKQLYYKNKYLGLLPAGVLTIYDLFINNSFRIGYKKQEYPIVRAQAALIMLNIYKKEKKETYLEYAKKHLDWLIENPSKGYSGYCWGLNAKWMNKNGFFDKNTPYVTNTVYVLETLVMYNKITNKFENIIKSIFDFLEKDIKILYKDNEKLALSYAPVVEPRIVINSNSYTMYMYVILLEFFPEKKEYIISKINKIYNFVLSNQQQDGSWYYYADEKPGNFIDCFHSCFVIKNIYKTSKIIPLDKSDDVVEKGLNYLLDNFYDKKSGLFRRFTDSDKPSLIKYDLYDNAEILGLLRLLNYHNKAKRLEKAIEQNFIDKGNIYSHIDILGIKRNKNMLRWAVIPYLLAKSRNDLEN